MDVAKPIVVRGEAVALGRVPAICVPLVGTASDEILGELDAVLAKAPDIVEWRVDHFAQVADTQAVIDLARRLRQSAGSTPILLTCRREAEGGRPTSLGAADVASLYQAVFASGFVDLADYEIGNGTANFGSVRHAARDHRVVLVGSFHDFAATPDADVLAEKFAQAKRQGADVAKVAVMPHDPGDVLALLAATLHAQVSLDMPLISMAMGPLGVLSRIAGFMFGSSLTFAAGVNASAPGQIPVEDLRRALDLFARAGN